MLYSEF